MKFLKLVAFSGLIIIDKSVALIHGSSVYEGLSLLISHWPFSFSF